MKRRFTSRPAPAASAITAVIGVFMLIFAIVFFSQAKAPPAIIGIFLVVWVVALVGVIIYHIVNATRPGGVPTSIIDAEDETDDDSSPQKSSAERLKKLEDLREQKLISDAEYESKRQEILKGI